MLSSDSTIAAPPLPVNFREKDIARFWSGVNKNGPTQPHMESSCWLWIAGKYNAGYGRVWANGKNIKTHRMSWLIHNGLIEQNMCVCHRCDVKECCRPDHLFLGTHADNVRDMKSKGRQARGYTHGSRTKPNRVARGDRHGSHTKPERVARGDRHCSRTKPERMPRGDVHGMAKLTDAIVIDIRARHAAGGITLKCLGEQFGVSLQMIHLIVRRKNWKHLP